MSEEQVNEEPKEPVHANTDTEPVHVGSVGDATTTPIPDYVTSQSFSEGMNALKREIQQMITDTFFKPPIQDTSTPGDVGIGQSQGDVLPVDIPGLIRYEDIKW